MATTQRMARTRTTMTMTTTSLLWVMTILLLLATTSTSIASSSDQIYVDSSYAAVTTGGSITFPLIPHHVQRSRRGLLTAEDNDLDAGGNSDRHRRRRRRREEEMSSDPKQMSALYQGYGTHYVDLWVGSPPQRQTVIVDTGSGLTAFPCGGCYDCGAPDYHIDNYFENDQSSTFQKSQCSDCSKRAHCNRAKQECRVTASYSEGSTWKAYEALDKCYIGGFHNKALTEDNGGTDDIDPGHAKAFGFPLRFGCQTAVTGLFKTQLADGILGMDDAKTAFWNQMYRAKKIDKKLFSLCYTRPHLTSRTGTHAGAMTLGGTDKRLHTSPMVYSSVVGTPSETKNGKSGYFDVHIRNLYWRDGTGGDYAQTEDNTAVVIKLNKGILNEDGVIVDSGTTDTYLSSVIQNTLETNFQTLSGKPFNHDKVQMSDEEIYALPTLLLQLAGDQMMNQKVVDEYGGGDVNKIPTLAGNFDPENPLDVIVAVPPSHYMESHLKKKYTNRLYDTEEDGSTLGANVMMGHDLLFDAPGKRIGWSESSCDYNGLITEEGYPDVLSGGKIEVVEEETLEDEEEKAEEQEDAKEAFDEDNIETEIHVEVQEDQEEEKETFNKQKIESEIQGEESILEKQQENEKEAFDKQKSEVGIDPPANDGMEAKKKKPSSGEDTHNYDNPIDDIQQQITDNPVIAGGGLVFILLLLCICCFYMYRCCCASRKKKTYRRQLSGTEIEMNGSSYKDDFVDEDDDDDGEYKDV